MKKNLLLLCCCAVWTITKAAPMPEERSNTVQSIVPLQSSPVVVLESDKTDAESSDLDVAEAAHYGYGGFGHGGGFGGGFGHGGGFGGGFGFRHFGGFGGGGFGHHGFGGGFPGYGFGGGGGGFIVGGGFIKGGGFYGKK
ncbi:keratin-associated protein 19-2-like [Anopheles moucheti]|uniref:keratin-associated protein 19-2-like n=1 Tax=Anopheles moucheti TaxID=186751 RepID=UPI0022EFF269|nr:keratin-associated protein 19-2-like [Anopheles moucheti]